MKLNVRWLKEYVNTQLDPETLGQRFLMTSSELEGLENWDERLAHVVVGEVLTCVDHPNSNKLHLTTVRVAPRSILHIVCGAPNVRVGLKVLVALPGAVIRPIGTTEKHTITKSVIRGEDSEGMLCAADELGLNLPSEGILILPETAVVGQSAAQALELDTSVLDLEITPNRPDLLSYFGLAREVATFENKSLREPEIAPLEHTTHSLPSIIHAEIKHAVLCRRFSALAFDVLPDATTPWWLTARLLTAGMRPVSPIVDITNYVMLELGQPMHAYDAALLRKDGVVNLSVGDAAGISEITLLDGTTRKTEPSDILIRSDLGVEGLAGIMGSGRSEITSSTTQFILEAATFTGANIRATSRRLGLRSEASTRFEKGIDPELTVTALKRATHLYQTLGIAKPASRLVDVYPNRKAERPRISTTSSRITDILGVSIPLHEAKSILQKLGFQVLSISKAGLTCTPPSWRADVTREEDIFEELIRIWGYDRVPANLPIGAVKPPQANQRFKTNLQLRRSAVARGFQDVIHLPFTNERQLQTIGYDVKKAIALDNPISSDQSHLIPTHLLPLLSTVAANQLQETSHYLEIGSVFSAPQVETLRYTALVRDSANPERLLQELKSLIETSLFEAGYLGDVTYEVSENSCQVVYQGEVLGRIYQVDDSIVRAWKIRRGRVIFLAELDLAIILKHVVEQPKITPLPTYPEIQRDLTLVVDEDCTWSAVATVIADHSSAILSDWNYQSSFRGKPLLDGKKSITVHFTYAADRTLTDAEVDDDQKTLLKLLETHHIIA